MDGLEKLRENYENLDEEGKQELREFSIEILKKWESKKTMTESEINMWSILISVIKNQNRKYDRIGEIETDIYDIKEMIRNLN